MDNKVKQNMKKAKNEKCSLGGSDSVLFQGPLPAGFHERNMDGLYYENYIP